MRAKKKAKGADGFFATVEKSFVRLSNNTRLSIVLLVLISSILGYYTFDRLLHLNGDNAVYLILGQSLSSGSGYRNIHTPAASFHSKYPPLFPAIVALTSWIAPGSLVAPKVTVVVLYLFLVVAVFWTFKVVSSPLALVLALLAATNFWINDFGHWIMSEVPSLLLIVISVGFLLRSTRRSIRFACLAGLFAGLAVLTRSFALFLLVSGALFLALRKQWKSVLCFSGISFSSLVMWDLLKTAKGASGGGYLYSIFKVNPYRTELGSVGLVDLFHRIYENVLTYFGGVIPSMFFPNMFSDRLIGSLRAGQFHLGLATIALLLLLFITRGLWVQIRSGEWLNVLLLISGLGILLIWPQVWTTQRFVIPLFPFMALAAIRGLEMTAKYAWGKPLLVVIFAAVLVSSVIRMSPGRERYPLHFANYLQASKWLQTNSQPEDIIACRKGEFTYLFSGRRCVKYKYTLDDRELIAALRTDNVKYVIVDQLGFSSTPRYLVPAIQKNQDKFKVVYATAKPENWVLRLVD